MLFHVEEAHCQYCMCPSGIWKPSLRTYKGNECKLLYDVMSVITEMEYSKSPFNKQGLLNNCRKDFEKDYSDIDDFEAVIYEILDIFHEEGYMPKNFRPLMIAK